MFQFKNKQNEQQNAKLSNNRELLAKRKDELARMDHRIHELQGRLKKKRAMTADMDKSRGNKMGPGNQLLNNRRPPNVAAVEPYIQEPPVVNNTGSHNNAGFGKQDPKYQSLPPSSKFMYPDKAALIRPKETNNNNYNNASKQQQDMDKSDEYSIPLVVSVDSSKQLPNGHISPKQSPVSPTGQHPPPYPGQLSSQSNYPPASSTGQNVNRLAPGMPARSSVSHFTPKPFGSTYNNSSSLMPNRVTTTVTNDHTPFDIQEEVRQAGSGQSSPGSVESLNNGTASLSGKSLPPYPQRDNYNKDTAQGVAKPQQKDNGAGVNVSPPDGGQGLQGSRNQGKDLQGRAPPPPVPNRQANNNTGPPGSSNQQANNSRQLLNSNNNNSANGNSNNSSESSDSEQTMSVSKGIQKFTGLISKNQNDGSKPHIGFSNLNHSSALVGIRPSTYRYASKRDIANTYLGINSAALEQYQQKVQNMHRDLNSSSASSASTHTTTDASDNTSQAEKLRDEEKDSLSPLSTISSPLSSTSTPSPATPPGFPTFDYAAVTPPHADVASDKVSFKPHTPKNVRRRHSDSDNEEIGKALHKYGINTNTKALTVQETQMREQENNKKGVVEIQATTFINNIPETVLLDNKGNVVEVLDSSKENSKPDTTEEVPDKVENVKIEVKSSEPKIKKKSNLKPSGAKKHKNRVSFDPLALLLDASLEGELDLVRRCAHQVYDACLITCLI